MPWQAFSAALTAGLRASSACSKQRNILSLDFDRPYATDGTVWFQAGISHHELAALQGKAPRE